MTHIILNYLLKKVGLKKFFVNMGQCTASSNPGPCFAGGGAVYLFGVKPLKNHNLHALGGKAANFGADYSPVPAKFCPCEIFGGKVRLALR